MLSKSGSIGWSIAEYLGLFFMVLLHEFGHALACRQFGGKAERILLWPLGGVAYIAPPQRPGAMLWSIAAGPLVNVVLLIPLAGLYIFLKRSGLQVSPDALKLVSMTFAIDLVLLVFNLLPIYPLDGGQIFRALLWYPMGRISSLTVSAAIGFVGAAAIAVYAFTSASLLTGAVAVFVFLRCFAGWKAATMLRQMASSPLRTDQGCPACHIAPPIGNYWRCIKCRTLIDAFETPGQCPKCREPFPLTFCPNCGQGNPPIDWDTPASSKSTPTVLTIPLQPPPLPEG